MLWFQTWILLQRGENNRKCVSTPAIIPLSRLQWWCTFTMVREGGWVEFQVTCASCHQSYSWESTARVKRAHIINTMLAAASQFSGGCLTQNPRFLSLLNIAVPSHSTCLYQQREYLHGVSINIQPLTWKVQVKAWHIK